MAPTAGPDRSETQGGWPGIGTQCPIMHAKQDQLYPIVPGTPTAGPDHPETQSSLRK
jgi:hypothetical protein